MTTPRQDDRLLHEIQLMVAAGWRLHQRLGPDSAVFTSGSGGSGISAGVHLILLVLTVGLWLPFLIVVELASSSRGNFCRLTFDAQGEPQYEKIKRPPR